MHPVANRLSIVSSELPAPPYDTHVMSNGYGFDMDVTRMQNSDSWVICPLDVRPWMMMSWVISWVQHPCGSLPSDDELIAARIGCSLEFLQVHRKFILRGWVRHSDGRLYHPIVAERVLAMIASREKWKAKKRGQRSKNQADSINVPGDTPETLEGVQGVSLPSSYSYSSSSSEEKGTDVPLSTDEADRPSPCPHMAIIDIYHDVLPELPGVVKSRWTGSSDAKALQARWREDKRHQSLDFWERFFKIVRTSQHWMGGNDREWKANLRWLVQRRNFDKAVERMADMRANGNG